MLPLILTIQRFRFIVSAKLTNVTADQIVHEGKNLELFREASGKPTPNITWTKVLEDGSNSGVLHQGANWNITNINRTDSGTYHCTAYNGFGNPVSRAINVNVLCEYMDSNSLVNNIHTKIT